MTRVVPRGLVQEIKNRQLLSFIKQYKLFKYIFSLRHRCFQLWDSKGKSITPYLYDLVSNHYFTTDVSVGVFFNVTDIDGHVWFISTVTQQHAEFTATFAEYHLLKTQKKGNFTYKNSCSLVFCKKILYLNQAGKGHLNDVIKTT